MRILVSPQNIFFQFIVNKRKNIEIYFLPFKLSNKTWFVFLSLTVKCKILTKMLACLGSVDSIKVPEVNVSSVSLKFKLFWCQIVELKDNNEKSCS